MTVQKQKFALQQKQQFCGVYPKQFPAVLFDEQKVI